MVKQCIAMRTDLGMDVGKMCAQAGHASELFILRKMPLHSEPDGTKTLLNHCDWEFSAQEMIWMFCKTDIPGWYYGMMKKIVLAVPDEETFINLQKKADDLNVKYHCVIDNALRVATCCAFGPDDDDLIDKITGGLPLLRDKNAHNKKTA